MGERTYTEQEVSALLERTAELQVQAARKADQGPGLTLAELEGIATESGLDPALVRKAAAELDEPNRSLFDSSTGTTATHVFVERWAPGSLTPEVWEDVVAELRHRYDSDLGSMMGMPGYGVGTTQQIGRTVEWRQTSMSGVETRVMIRERGDALRIRIGQRVGWGSSLAEASAYGSAVAVIAAIIVGNVVGSGLVGLGVFLLALVAALPLILVADQAWRRKKHRELEALANDVAALVSSPSSSSPEDVRDRPSSRSHSLLDLSSDTAGRESVGVVTARERLR